MLYCFLFRKKRSAHSCRDIFINDYQLKGCLKPLSAAPTEQHPHTRGLIFLISCRAPLPVFLSTIPITVENRLASLGWKEQSADVARLRHFGMCHPASLLTASHSVLVLRYRRHASCSMHTEQQMMSSPALKSILDPYELRRRRKPSRIRYLHLPESTRQPLHQRNPSSDRLCPFHAY
ncbi:hypothetical protein KCV03_g349, partial [Aureobasidium melanogenum]